MANGLFNLKQVMQAVQQGGWPAQKTPSVEYLVVAGGGGGAGGSSSGGGGGAGGLLSGIDPVPNGQTLLVTVGASGAGATSGAVGSNGGNSVFGSISSTGGGGGGGSGNNYAGIAGGSGGGTGADATANFLGGQGISGQGNSGGIGNSSFGNAPCGGGGGAGTVGNAAYGTGLAGNGGAGIASSISGTVTTYAGGGGGGTRNTTTAGVGGVGGGGAGGNGTTSPVNGTLNTGGGGGGGGGAPNAQNGANGGTGIVIVSYPDVYAAPTATTGSPTVSTSGSGSVTFNAASYLNYGNQTALHLGSGNFTVEMWLYKVANTAYMTACGDLLTGSGTNTFQIVADATGTKITWYEGSSGGFPLVSTTSIALNTWYHVAFVRNSSTVTLYINGVSEAVATLTTNYNATTSFFVGQTPELIAGRYWDGYISNFRMVKGTAVYTSNFTPSAIPLTAISNTSLLLNAVSGARLADSSGNNFTATTTGPLAWSASSPFTGTGYKNRVYTWTSSGSITF